MRKMTIGLALALAMATGGCSTVKSGLSALGGGKPHQVTVVNNIEAPGVDSGAPLAQLPPPKKRSRRGQLKATVSGAVAGALVGTAVGYAIDGSNGAAKGAALGAGAGAVGGAAAHQTR